MRRAVTRRLLQGQDVCLFCALRHGFEYRATGALQPQRRLYKSTTPSRRPAGAAAARVEEVEDGFHAHTPAPVPKRELLGWKCRCNHVNASHRAECTICTSPRPQNAELVHKENNSHRQPTSHRSLSSNSASPAASREPARQDPPLSSGSSDQSTSGPSRPRFDSRTILDQANAPFTPYQPAVPGQQRPPRSGRTRHGADESLGESAQNQSFRHRNRLLTSEGPIIKYSSPRAPRTQQDSGARVGGFTGTSGFGDQRRPQFEYGRRDGWHTNGKASGTGSPSWRQPGSYQNTHNTRPANRPMNDTVPTDTRIGRTVGTTRREGSVPRDSNIPRSSFREPRQYREPRPDSQQRNGFDRGGRKGAPQMTPRDARRPDSDRTGRVSEFPAIPDDGAVETVDAAVLDGSEEDWYRRRTAAQKERNRRGRVYDVETEEPFHTSQMASSPVRTKRVPRQSTLDFDPDMVEELLDETSSRRKKKKGGQAKAVPKQPARPEIRLPEFITVEKLAQGLKVKLQDFIDKLEEEGFEGARYDHILDSGTSAMFAEIYGFEPIISTVDESRDIVARPPPEDPSLLPPRPPIVTIMGHVDHGKTTILDYFRRSSIVASEHGGITQHIGAFSVTMPGSERNITFLDTPGHAAFLEMRRRGANVTDIVVLVVAADDSVKAQTVEAIKHALESKVQIIVAINKVDKEDANIERVKQDLARHDIVVEDYGGEYQAIPVSGKTGQGMGDLEEAILTLADVADFRAETDGQAEGWIIESKVGPSGRVATVLVRRGTLRPGDFIVAGTTWARVRTLRNDSGQLIDEAPPGTPVQIDGWRGGDPMAGDEVLQAENEARAKEAVEVRQEREEAARAVDDMTAINTVRSEDAEARAKVLEWEKEQGYLSMRANRRPKDNEGWVEKEQSGPRQVHFVIKADVAGSTEALVAAVSAIGNNEVVANIIHSGTGSLTESDIKLLAATGEVGYAISFNQPVDASIRRLAEAARLQILDHNIIYKVTDDVKDKMSDALPPIVTQRVLGEAEVGEIFDIHVKKTTVKIAGCRVTNGTIRRSEKIRVLRNGEVVYTGMLSSFKNIKKDVTEMRKGSECGMGFENWEDFQVGDQIQSFEEIKEKRTLY
ncbi:Translation initiation factor IF-2, mitochondrial [Exophiala dermatitidis]